MVASLTRISCLPVRHREKQQKLEIYYHELGAHAFLF